LRVIQVQLEVISQTGQWCRSDMLAMALLGGSPAACPRAAVTLKTHLLHSKCLAANWLCVSGLTTQNTRNRAQSCGYCRSNEIILLTSLVMHPPHVPVFWQGLTDACILLIFI